MSTESAVLATVKETVEPATAMSTVAATHAPLDGATLADCLESLMAHSAHSNSFPLATLQHDTASSTEEAAAAAATADPAATAATAGSAATAATADPAAPDPPSVRLRGLRDALALGLTIEDVVGVDPEQLEMSLPFMKKYFALWHRLKKMAPNAGQLNKAEVAEFKTALKHLETIGNMSFRDFWEPWFATPKRIEILESRLAIALSDVEDKSAYYDKNDKASGRFHQLVIAYALTGDHSIKYEYPPDEWLRRYVDANGLCVRKGVSSAAWTPGMIGIRTSKMMTDKPFLSEVEDQIRVGAFVALCPSVVVATLSRGRLPEPNAGYMPGVAQQSKQTAKRFIAIKGVGAAELSSGVCGDCVKNFPKVLIGPDKVRYLVIPNEDLYKPCIMDVLKSLWWGHGYLASMAIVNPRVEPTANMYNIKRPIPVPVKPAPAAAAATAAATAAAATATAATTAAAATATAAATAAAASATTEAAATATAVAVASATAAAVAVAPHQPAK